MGKRTGLTGHIRKKILDHPDEAIEALLEGFYWPQTLKTDTAYQRYEDDSMRGNITVTFSDDADAWIKVISTPDENGPNLSMRFCMPSGGGQSPRVRSALLILAEAIRLDNMDRPQHRKSRDPA